MSTKPGFRLLNFMSRLFLSPFDYSFDNRNLMVYFGHGWVVENYGFLKQFFVFIECPGCWNSTVFVEKLTFGAAKLFRDL